MVEEGTPLGSTPRRRGSRGKGGKARSNPGPTDHSQAEAALNDASSRERSKDPNDSLANDTLLEKHSVKKDGGVGGSPGKNVGKSDTVDTNDQPPARNKKWRKKTKKNRPAGDQSESGEPSTSAKEANGAAEVIHTADVKDKGVVSDKPTTNDKSAGGNKGSFNGKANAKAIGSDKPSDNPKKKPKKKNAKEKKGDKEAAVEMNDKFKQKPHKPAMQEPFGGVIRNRQRHWGLDSALPMEITQYASPNRNRSKYSDNWRQAAPAPPAPEPVDRPLTFVTNEGKVDHIHFVNAYEHNADGGKGDKVLAEFELCQPKTAKKKKREDKPVPNKKQPPRQDESYVHPDDQVVLRRPVFAPFLSPRDIEAGLKDGSLQRGHLRINKRNRSEAYVTADGLDRDIFIFGQRDRNRALNGDVVAVRLVDVEKIWAMKKEKMRLRAEAKKDEHDESESQDGLDEEIEKNKPKYCGEVVGIIDRQWNQTFAGILYVDRPQSNQNQKENGGRASRLVWFKPTDKRTPLIAIPLHLAPPDILTNAESYETHILTACILRWPIDLNHPFGQIVQFLGPIGSLPAEASAILTDNSINDNQFPKEAIQNLPKTPWKIPAAEYTKRRDLRETRIFTIDPSTAKDLDDAVHVIKQDDGTFEVGVHIADVSYFVRNHGALDKEARERGTSTYLVDRVIPMLPSLLCEELCSLNPGVERLAFSVIWKMDSEGNVLDTWFGKTIIRSCAKLAYDDAQSVIDGKGLPKTQVIMYQRRSSIEEDIMTLFKLSQHMRKRRFDNGALTVGSIRLSFQLGADGEPNDVWVYELKEANRLIEEFMLCANISVAQKISSTYPDEALLRRHEQPNERKLDEFVKLADKLGFHLDGSSAGSLQESLHAIEDKDALAVLILLAIKPMQRAKYFCTGSMDISKYRHYALNVPLYTHFTSPIRRYADVIVHRMLEAAIQGKDSCGYSLEDVKGITDDCNRNSDNARNAQDQSIDLYLARYLYHLEMAQGPIVRSAIVVGVVADAFDIMVPEYGIEKRIHTDALPLQSFKFDAASFALDVYWKKGVPVISFMNGEEEDIRSADNMDDEDGVRQANIPVATASEVQSLPNETIEASSGLQRFEVFTKFDVIVQTNMHRTPPVVNVYPINPFAPWP
ncbi:hypothetical protein BJV82DRAFT_620412 [Fennellomyces sp. T-0311]|nr:hypothetical protein BJV82DRAFT_620412 [Fennellomyces sp. T-0311]